MFCAAARDAARLVTSLYKPRYLCTNRYENAFNSQVANDEQFTWLVELHSSVDISLFASDSLASRQSIRVGQPAIAEAPVFTILQRTVQSSALSRLHQNGTFRPCRTWKDARCDNAFSPRLPVMLCASVMDIISHYGSVKENRKQKD